MKILVLAAALSTAMITQSLAEPVADPIDATIETSDVDAFFRVYDAARGRPGASALRAYVQRASPGVQGFIPNRIVSAENLASVVAAEPAIYANARDCAGRLGDVRGRVRAAFLALEALYPEAVFPKTYVLIGANNSGGTANRDALMIGLEVVCRSGAQDTSALDIRITHLIAHEMIHSLQHGFEGETVLAQSLNEGAAEFLTELISGRISNIHLIEWTSGHEADIEARFAADMESRDLSPWLYNGVGAPEAPGDLGYWVGYRIARAYYERQPDKRRAVREILTGADARAFWEASGWRPQARQ